MTAPSKNRPQRGDSEDKGVLASPALLAAWRALILDRWPLRQAMTRHIAGADLPPRLAAETALALRDLAARRTTLEFALGPELPPGARRATALWLAREVLDGRMDLRAARGVEPLVDWQKVLDCDARIDAIIDPIDRFACRYALPRWAAERLQTLEHPALLAQALLEAPPRTLRVSTRLGTAEALAQALAKEGIATAPGTLARAALIAPATAPVLGTSAWREGRYELQDEASQLAAEIVQPPPHGKILDACAGAGGKTMAMGDLLNDQGLILALDPSPVRVKALKERARRARLSIVRALETPEEAWPAEAVEFARKADRIVLDLPCTGLGSLRRRPEIRWSFDPTSIDNLLATQRNLALRAADALAPGARLILMTCTFGAEENENLVQTVLERHPDFEVVPPKELLGKARCASWVTPDERFLSLRPDRHGTDGFFTAVLRRRRPARPAKSQALASPGAPPAPDAPAPPVAPAAPLAPDSV